MDVGEEDEQVVEHQLLAVVLIDGVHVGALAVVPLGHGVLAEAGVVVKLGAVGLGVADGHTARVGAGALQVLAGEDLGGVAVVHEIKEGGVVHPAVVHVVALDVLGDELAVGVGGVLGGHMIARPVHAVLVAVIELAVEVAFQVPLVVVVVGDVLLLHHALADVDIERLPGQHQAEELVTGRAHGADVRNVVVVGEQGHETGDAALHLDLKKNIRSRQALLGAAGLDVVHHHRGDALAFGVVGVFLVAGEHIGLVGLGSGLGRGLHAGFGGAAGGGGLIAAAGGEQADRHGQGQQDAQQTFHVLVPSYSAFYCRRRTARFRCLL